MTNQQAPERSITRRFWASFATGLFAVTTSGCSGTPMFNILGSYFRRGLYVWEFRSG
jgi:hypothetical protein